MQAYEINNNNDNSQTWKVLIVDNSPDIHSAIELALFDLTILDYNLAYIHAYSAQDACQFIKDNSDIVLVLVNVVMATDDAEFNVVKYIREKLGQQDIRIILITDQPGYYPEEMVIKDYDISDYKSQPDLTRPKLMPTVYAAIRSYQQILAVNKNHFSLERIISVSSGVLEQHSLEDYAKGVITEFIQLFGDNILAGLFCKIGHEIVDSVDDFYILGQIGFSSEKNNQKLDDLKNQQASQLVAKCFEDKQHQFTDDNIALYFTRGEYQGALFFEINSPLSETNKQLIDVLLTNIAIGYENVHLFQKLSHSAYKDWLTDLPNRSEFVNFLDDFSQSDDNDTVAALIDINHFSDINDGLGQAVGNQLLVAVAKRLGQLSHQCQLARVAADVFGIIGPSTYVNPSKLIALFNQPLVAGEQILLMGVCIGFCTKNHVGSGGGKILNQINIALNLAKKTPDEHFIYYRQEMEDKTLWRLGMIRQLRTDFSENRLELWYQPQLSLTTGKVIGAEALLRWHTADGTFIPPDVFIPLAEYSGLIIEIGDWVINQACWQIEELETLGYNYVGISVNVSIPQFRRGDFVEKIIRAIQLHQIEPGKLELEITESILMDEPQIVVDALTKLKEQGVSIALDDFGTGYSSLRYLQKLPLDRLKVDRTFVTDINQKGKSIIAETIITLAKQMNLKIIAEGIEKFNQQERLIELDCDEVQGFYYAKPLPRDEFLAFLANNK